VRGPTAFRQEGHIGVLSGTRRKSIEVTAREIHRCDVVALRLSARASINCAVIRTYPPDRRMVPSTTGTSIPGTQDGQSIERIPNRAHIRSQDAVVLRRPRPKERDRRPVCERVSEVVK
jgi:hypothetical protein